MENKKHKGVKMENEKKAIGWIKSIKFNDGPTTKKTSLKIEFKDHIKYENEKYAYTLEGGKINVNDFEKVDFYINCLDISLLYQLYSNKEILVFEFREKDKEYIISAVEIYNV